MNLKNVAIGSIVIIGLLVGLRYVSSTIRYGCHQEPIVNVDGGDDCPPPFVAAGQLGFYLTGGPLNPLWNSEAITVRKVQWKVEKANPSIESPDDFRYYEQKLAADITTFDGETKRYDLGTAYGCTGATTSELQNRTIVIGRVKCDFAGSSTTFSAFKHGKGFSIERYDESAKDGSVATTTLLKI